MEAMTIQGTIDLQKYIDAVDVSQIPTEKEIDDILVKRLTKDKIQLVMLGNHEVIEKGDVVTFSISSSISKYNKEKLVLAVGNGLYNKDVEKSMLGRRTGEQYSIVVDDTTAVVIIKEVKRKIVPEPTDAMAEAMNIPEVHTISQYREYLNEEILADTIYPIAGEIMEQIEKDYKVSEPSEETIHALKEEELKCYRQMILDSNNVDILTATPETLHELLGIDSLDCFESDRREWYIQQAKQCIIASSILGIEIKDEYDPTKNFDAHGRLLGELGEKLFNSIMDRVKGGN